MLFCVIDINGAVTQICSPDRLAYSGLRDVFKMGFAHQVYLFARVDQNTAMFNLNAILAHATGQLDLLLNR
jgi:hypothetical protein